jgi:hypothetical protein
MCQLKALALVKEQGIDSFKASHGWIMRFFTRNELCIRRKTSVSQRLPDAYEEKSLCFQKYIINLWRQHSYIVSQIGSANRTLVYFEMPLDTTDKRGDKNVTERTGGNERQRYMVMLCISANSRKLLLYIVLKRKTLPKSECKRCDHRSTRIKGWMDQALVLDWINHVWQQRPGALLNLHSMLILDSFHGHTTEEVKKILKSRNTDQVIIPGGLTLMLQLLDVCINWPFKAALKEQYTRWMAAGEREFMPTEKNEATRC